MSPNRLWNTAVRSAIQTPGLILGPDLRVQDGIMDPPATGRVPAPEAQPGTGAPAAAPALLGGRPAPQS